MTSASAQESESTHRQAGGLVASVFVIAVIWLVVLPWWSRQPAMAQRLEWLDERGIDPSAMFYTELEYMDPILRHRPNHSPAGKPQP